MKQWFTLLIIVCAAGHGINAQQQQFSFNNLGEKDGLRNNIVFSFLKDSHGILWIGTQNGLNRFDGSHFFSFKKTRDANSLPNNTINCLCEDKKGNIWGGTVNGVFCYSPADNKFTTYYAPNDAFDNIVSNIQCDKQGDIFAATSVAFMKFDRQKKSFRVLTRLTDSKDSAEWYSLGKNRMLRDEENDGLWIASRKGLLYYDIKQQRLSGFNNTPGVSLFSKRSTAALSRSPKGYYWFFDNTARAFIAFDPASKKELKQISIKEVVPDARGAAILEDSQERLWFSSWSYDLLTIDLANNNKVDLIDSKERNRNSVAAGFFWAAMEDENGTIWLGTPNGISMCNPGKTVYKACHLPDKIPALQSTAIYIIEEDPIDRNWWIVTSDLKVIRYFPGTSAYTLYDLTKAVPDKKGLRPGMISHLRFADKRIIITSTEGAWEIQPSVNAIVPYKPLPEQYDDLVMNDIIEADSLLYITDGLRMLVWNKTSRKGSWITNNNTVLQSNTRFGFSHLLWKPRQTFFWAMAGDYIFSAANNMQANPVKLVKNATLEAGGYFHSADMDNEGNVWVNNKGVGLYRYNPHTKEVRYWSELDGLADNNMHSIKADDKGNVWTLYFNQASVFNPAKNSFINFTIPYSENNLNYYNWSAKRKDGVIMGSVANDVFEFYADNLNRVPVKKTPQLCVINISGRDYINTAVEALELKPDENSLRFKFGLLTDPSLYPHEFDYMLEGSDKNWVHSSAGNEAVYNNLPPGTYTFHVIARGRNNAWQSFEKVIKVKIKTPFYKSSLFLGSVVVLIAAILFWLYQYRLRQQRQMYQLRSKAQLLEKEKTMVMYESLKQQLNPHFLFNSLTSLSGLIATDQELAGSFLEQMSGIYRYILKNGDKETVTVKDEIEFVKLYISLQQTRFKKGLQVNINVAEDFMHYKIAPVTLQNLIENAIKHNIIDVAAPLVIDISTEDEYLVVKNNLQKKNNVETSNKKGLAQFASLYKYLSIKPVLIEETGQFFKISIPLI